MYIETEETPNPLSLKFLPGRPVTGDQAPVHLVDLEEAALRSPLALRLLSLDGVSGVFLGRDFVTVSRQAESEWVALRPRILGALMEWFMADRPVLHAAAAGDVPAEDNEIVVQIKDLLDTRVRPAVAQDGGDIVFDRFEDGVVYLHMHGSCSGCPSSTMTLKAGIENLLTHYIPEVVEVRAV